MSAGTRGDSFVWESARGGHPDGVPTVAWIVFTFHGALALTLLGLTAIARRRRSRAAGHPPDEDGGDDGGSQPRVPPTIPPGPPDYVEPEWWPEFERELADYQRELAGR